MSVSTSSARRSSVSELGSSSSIEKMFEGPETFVIGNDSIKKCNIHNENKFVLAKEIKVTKNFKCVLAVLNVGW